MMRDPCIINPGILRHSITIQAPSTVRDASGQPGKTWNDVLSTRACIESTSSNSFKFSFQNNTLAANTSDCLTIRYPSVNIEPGMRVLFGDQTYNIQAVDDLQRRHRVLRLACVGIDTGSM